MLRVDPRAAELLPLVDSVIFDVDGVLMDVSRSIRAVNCLAIPVYLRSLPGWFAPDDLIASEEIELFKRAGGFNDDWDLTCAAVLLYLFKAVRYGQNNATVVHTLTPTVFEYTDIIADRGGWLAAAESYLKGEASSGEWGEISALYDPSRIRRIFQELWAGDWCPRVYGFEPMYFPREGKVRLDRPLLDVSLLPQEKQIGILTGRTLSEAQLALEMCGLSAHIPLPERGITQNDGYHKPHPGGLVEITRRFGSRVALYIGDTRDDLRTVLAFRRLPEAQQVTILSAQVLTGTVGAEAHTLFAEADVVAEDVNVILHLLRGEYAI